MLLQTVAPIGQRVPFPITLDDLAKLNKTASIKAEILERMKKSLSEDHPNIMRSLSLLTELVDWKIGCGKHYSPLRKHGTMANYLQHVRSRSFKRSKNG